jgi:hypothetical protein
MNRRTNKGRTSYARIVMNEQPNPHLLFKSVNPWLKISQSVNQWSIFLIGALSVFVLAIRRMKV